MINLLLPIAYEPSLYAVNKITMLACSKILEFIWPRSTFREMEHFFRNIQNTGR